MTYLLLANLSLILFFGIYSVFLKPLTFFQWNRVYLLSAAIISFFVPLLQFVDLSAHRTTYAPLTILDFTDIEPIVLSATTQAEQRMDPMEWATMLYIVGVISMFIGLCWRLWKLSSLFKQQKGGTESFSFFNRVVVGKDVAEPLLIYAHEQVHVKQGHSYDILLLELVRIFNWFNPVLYFYLKELKLQHECIADEKCAADKAQYAELLLANALQVPHETLRHAFSNHSFLKKRIMMLFKNKSRNINRLKYIVMLPMVLFICGVAVGFNASLSAEVKASIGNIANLQLDGQYVAEQLPWAVQQDTIMAYADLEIKPTPKGGMEAFRKWVQANYTYPQEAVDAGVKGRVEVSFIIEKDGSLSSFRIVRDLKHGTGEALVETLEKAGKWSPGKLSDGQKVKVAYTLPISLNLSPTEKTESQAKATLTKENIPAGDFQDLSEVNVRPSPIGGIRAFRKWVQENYRYPQEAIDAGVKGRMQVTFTIEEDGTLSSFKKVKDLGYGTTDALVEVLKQADKWRPAIVAGKPIKSTYTLPLNINLKP